MRVLEKTRLDGKVAIVTGAGRGLGREMALALADAGADIVAAARTQTQIDETAHLVRVKGRRCITVQTDVTNPGSVNRMVEATFAEFERIDILVNNAGGATRGWNKPLENITDEQWHDGVSLNITAHAFSDSAREKITAAGGTVTELS